MLAIVTDSTCDLRKPKLEELKVERVPLYVNFKGKTHKDWLEITPDEIISGVQAGANLPTTSQPSPQDFADAYKAAIAKGATEILCLNISSNLSGTYQSALAAKEHVKVPVSVFDSRFASLGLGAMVDKAAVMRNSGASLKDIMPVMEHMRDNGTICFTVGTLEFLQKGGRIGRANALLGSLLNIKPVLSLDRGTVVPIGRARGAKKGLKMLVDEVEKYASQHQGKLVAYFVHVQDQSDVETLRQAIAEAGIEVEDKGSFEMGAVIACHTGPHTYGFYLYNDIA
ncbi:MAG: DegV family protein [Deinococcales bacterium]